MVRVFRDKSTTSATSTEYSKAEKVVVQDSHLLVTGAALADVYAVYAPGTWHHAEAE